MLVDDVMLSNEGRKEQRSKSKHADYKNNVDDYIDSFSL